MGNFFSLDSPLMQGLGKLVDLVILNVLTIVCCIPIVTVGAAVTALYDVTGRLMRDEGRLWSDYWKAFRSNFKQATVLWLIFLGIGCLLLFSLYFYTNVEMAGQTVLYLLAVMLILVWAIALSWVFPLQAKFYNKIKDTIRNAVYCGIAYLPRSVLMAVMNMLPWVLMLFWPALFLQISILWVGVWFALAAWVNLLLLKKPFRKLIGETEEAEATLEEIEG